MKLFLSSTFLDLRDERHAVLELATPDHYLTGMELFLADPEGALRVALRNLRACDAMLLVIGSKAGSLVSDRRGLTYTRAEFDFARRWHIPVFAFIKTENGRWRNDETEQELQGVLNRFKADVEAAVKPDYFGSLADLQKQVIEALAAWERRGRPGARKVFTEHQQYFKQPPIAYPLFNYDQVLRGRTRQIEELNQFLTNQRHRVAIMLGRGGIGKSKLLHDWTSSQRAWQVLFLKDRAAWHAEVEREIPEGNVLLVMDDAHQAENLERSVLLAREAGERHNLKLLLSLRPSGKQMVESVVARRFDSQEIATISELQQLSAKEVHELAEEVLGAANGRYVSYLTAISKDNPLVTVVGGQLIASRRIDPAALTASEDFRRAVFSRFLQEIETALPNRQIDFRSLLHLVSAVGPAALNTDPLLSAASSFLRLRPDELLYGIDLLEKQGLILRRGYTQRIVPDVLSDYLLEERCLTTAGESTGYAEALYHAMGGTALSNILRNLAELDWKIAQKTASASLLEKVWHQITKEFTGLGATARMSLLQQIKPAAAYQPRPVMELIRIAMDGAAPASEGGSLYRIGQDDVLRQIPPLLEAIAYHADLTEEAVRRLWRLAVNDRRPPNQFPEHAIRVLGELASYDRYKPVSLNMRMAELLEKLAGDDVAFQSEPTPFDVLETLLAREGSFTESAGLTVTLGGFELNYGVVGPVRERALGIINRCLYSENGRKAVRALKSISVVIHGWIPNYGRSISSTERKWQQQERLTALRMLETRLTKLPLPIPFLREAYSILDGFLRWAHEGPVMDAVRRIYESIRLDDELFEFHMLCESPFRHRKDEDWRDSQKRWEADLKAAARNMRERIPDAVQRVNELIRMYSWAKTYGVKVEGGIPFVNELCADPAFLESFAQRLLNAEVPAEVAHLIDPVLRRTKSRNLEEYLDLGRKIALHPNIDLVRGAASSVSPSDDDGGLQPDLTLLELFSRYPDWWVKRGCILGLQRWTFILKQHPDPGRHTTTAIQIALAIDIGADAELADELCEIFSTHDLGIQQVSGQQIQLLLEKLVVVHNLDKYWIGEFLNAVAAAHPALLCDFLLARIKRARDLRAEHDWNYRAVPYDFSGTHFHRLKGTDRYEPFLKSVRDMVADSDYDSDLYQLFWRVGTLDDETLSVLDEWLHVPEKVKYVMNLLSEAISGIAFSRPWFAFHVLEASSRDPDLLRSAIGGFVWNAMPHSWSAAPGQPPQVFVETQERAQQFLETHKDMPLALKLYHAIEQSAAAEVRRHILEGEEFDV